jgi:hypothetical protein
MTLDEFKQINKGNSLTRHTKTGSSYEWYPIPISNTDTIEVSMEVMGNMYCIDIDTCEIIDGITYGNYNYNDLPEFLKACPYTKSRNKGNPHIWFKIHGIDSDKLKTNGWKNANDNLAFCDGELLTRMTWEYKNSEVYNYNGHIPSISWDDIKTLLKDSEVIKWSTKCNLESKPEVKKLKQIKVQPVIETITTNEIKHDVKYNQIREHAENISKDKYLTTGKYDDWIHIIWALRSLNDDTYKQIAIELAIRCGRDIPLYVDTYWNNFVIGKGWSIASIFHFSKLSNEKIYNSIKIKYGTAEEKNILDNLTLQNMITFASESDFAETFYIQFKNNLVLDGSNIYLYYKNEWRIEREDKTNILIKMIDDWSKIYIKCCFILVGQLKGNNIDNKDMLDELSKVDNQLLKMNNGLKKVNFCKNVSQFLKSKMAVVFDKPIFDIGEKDHYNINFKNGVFEMNTGIFRERCYYDYITKWLDYDYIELSSIPTNIQDDVFDFFQKIQPNEIQRNFTLGYLSYALTGNIDKQKFKMNVGYSAQNGKSTEIGIHDICFPIYTKKITRETFELGYTKRHKHILDLLNNPVRLAYVEELSEKKMDVDFIKDFVDAKKITCEVMFGTDKSNRIQAKLMTCSQTDFNGKTDEGIKRRGMVQHYTSKFLKDDGINIFNNDTHIYKRIDGFEKRFVSDQYKNAYFHLLLKYTDKLEIPKINEDAFRDICDENDYFKNKLFEEYHYTDCDTDVVYWKDIARLFGAISGKEDRKLIANELKRLCIKYDKDLSGGRKGTKGCYIGLKLIEKIEEINQP